MLAASLKINSTAYYHTYETLCTAVRVCVRLPLAKRHVRFLQYNPKGTFSVS